MEKAQRLTLALTSLLLTACGQHLGSYAVQQARVVTQIPPSHLGSPSPSYGQYLEIGIASKTSLTSIGGNVDAVYVDADFCPLSNRNGLIAFGPYGDDGQDLGLPRDAKPLRAGTDGLFRYRLYVVIAYTAQRATASGQLPLPTYNLKGSNRDLCLRLFAPGYNLIKSRSETIRVPAEIVSSALKGAPAPRPT